jgi:hypothetical protein
VCVYIYITFQGTCTLFTEFSTHAFIYTSTFILQCHKSTNLHQILGAFAKLRKATTRSEVMWSEVKWCNGEVRGVKSTMYIRVTLHWGYLIVLWMFYVVCVLYCGCFNLFCNVCVCVCVCVCVWEGCFGNMCACISYVLYCLYYVFVLFRLYIFILICFVCTSVRTTATEWNSSCIC